MILEWKKGASDRKEETSVGKYDLSDRKIVTDPDHLYVGLLGGQN